MPPRCSFTAATTRPNEMSDMCIALTGTEEVDNEYIQNIKYH